MTNPSPKNVYLFLFYFLMLAAVDFGIAFCATLLMPGADIVTVFIAILIAQAMIITYDRDWREV